MYGQTKTFDVSWRNAIALILSSYIFTQVGLMDIAFVQPSVGFGEYISMPSIATLSSILRIGFRSLVAEADIFSRDHYVLR